METPLPAAPTVSVIVPTWNRADWLTATVESALAQTRAPLEVIVVDDGSTDQTGAVAASLPAGVRYVRQANAGVAAARNTGAREARGDLLAFLDCEDLWKPRKLEIQLAALRQAPEVGWSITGCLVVDLQNRPVPGVQGWERVFPPFRRTGRAPDAFFGEDLSSVSLMVADRQVTAYVGDPFRLLCFGNFGLPSSALVRRDLFEAMGGFNPEWRLAEETEFFHRVATFSPVAIVMEPLVRYRVGQAGALTSPANTVTLISNALRSLDGARALRGTLTSTEDEAWRAGRQRLLHELAYASLASFDPRGARKALATLRAEAGRITPRTMLLRAASLLPAPALRLVHRLKRAVA